MPTGQPEVPTAARIRLAHASAQRVAERAGVDVLHIKGAALDPTLNVGRRESTDADVLVRPEHVRRYVAALPEAGWTMWCDFDEGSLFEHAASFHHEQFGMLDVHQVFPGLHHDASRAFQALWRDRVDRPIAQVPCQAPGEMGEHLVMLLHAGRTPGQGLDVANHWTDLDDQTQQQVSALASRLGAGVGLAAALDDLDTVKDPEAELWRLMRDNSDRLGEWRARWRAASGWREHARLGLRAVRVNRFQLGQNLGRPPTRQDVRREWWRRLGAGAAAALARRPGRR